MQADPRGSYSSNIPPAPPSGVGSSAGSSSGGQGSVSSHVGEALSGQSTPQSLEGSHVLDPAELSHALNKLDSFQHDAALAEHKEELIEWIKAHPEDVKILREAHPEVLKDQKFIAEIRDIVSSASDEKGARIKHFTQKTTEHNAFAERLQAAKADIIKNYNARRDSIEAKHTSAVFKMMSKLHQLNSTDQNFLTKYLQKAYIAVKFAIVNIQHDRAISKLENQTFKQTSKINEKINHNEALLVNLGLMNPSSRSLETLQGIEKASSEVSTDSDESSSIDEVQSYEYTADEFEKLLKNANKALKTLEPKKGDLREQLLKETKNDSPIPAESISAQEVRKSVDVLRDVAELDQLMLDYTEIINEAVQSQQNVTTNSNDAVQALLSELLSIKSSQPEPEDFGDRVKQTLELSEALDKGLKERVSLTELDTLVKSEVEDRRMEASLDSLLAQLMSEGSEIGKRLVHLHDANQILNQLVEPYADEAKVLSDEVGDVIEQKARTALANLDLNQLKGVKLKVTGRREALLNPEVLDKVANEGGIDTSPLPSMATNKTGRLEELTQPSSQDSFNSIYEGDSEESFENLLNKLKEGAVEQLDEPLSSDDANSALAELDAIIEENERSGT